ncbi:CMRF35-like molecule 8 [Carassius auratus]|uniref:CMRF35-like molecule 8 n=1 Tax=Carassius auratus TaxID=7957 RepID=A0A6P6QJL9_CARAU|nr:CMRF35-like molecule 8 [Carassius auratus]
MFSMCVVLLVFSSISTAVVGAPETVTGHRGERVDIRCPYESGYKSNSKYLCKGECIYGFRNILVKSGSPAEDERFSLTDDKRTSVFTISITDLRTEDTGRYWCGVERTLADVYSEIKLLVKEDQIQQTTSITTTERKTTITDQDSSSTGDVWSTESVIYVSVGLVLVMIIFLAALTVLCRKRRKKSTRVTQSGLSPQVSIVLLSLNEHTAEEIDCNDPKHEDINKMKGKNKDIHTIYTAIDRPEESSIYSTADKPEESSIYTTADKPEDSVIYTTADKPEDSVIYSTAGTCG